MRLEPSLGIDGRTERNHSQVMDPESWVQIFDRLKALPETTQHLVILFPVPFSFIRLKAVENVFAFLANSAPWVRRLPGIKSTNSIFGLPEFYDDLLDEWCHDSHIVSTFRKSAGVAALKNEFRCTGRAQRYIRTPSNFGGVEGDEDHDALRRCALLWSFPLQV